MLKDENEFKKSKKKMKINPCKPLKSLIIIMRPRPTTQKVNPKNYEAKSSIKKMLSSETKTISLKKLKII